MEFFIAESTGLLSLSNVLMEKTIRVRPGQRILVGVTEEEQCYLYHVAGTYKVPKDMMGDILFSICLN